MAAKSSAKSEPAKPREDGVEGPLMDGMNAAVKKMLAKAKERGYVTYDELNAVLPQEQMSSEQIEDTLALLNEMGINVVENEEAEEGEPQADNDDAGGSDDDDDDNDGIDA